MPSKEIVYVYPDVAFGISFIMNLVILWSTARLARLTTKKKRLLLGAFFGAIYSGLSVFPHLVFLQNFFVKMGFASLMFLASFFPLSWKRFAGGFTYFLLVSFSIGGIFFGMIFLLNSGQLGKNITQGLDTLVRDSFLSGLFITLLIILLLAVWGIPFYRKRSLQDIVMVPLRVCFADYRVDVEALIDTGNHLQDPISQSPVVVVEYNALSSYLPGEMKSFFEADEPDFSRFCGVVSDKFWSTRLRLIPFCSLGRNNGMLIGFRPDQIEVKRGEQVLTKKDVIVGIYNKSLSPEGNYKALLNPELLQDISA